MGLQITVPYLGFYLVDWGTKANSEEYRIGLFSNDITPTPATIIDDITPCDFGGYSGLQYLNEWDTGNIITSGETVHILHPAKSWISDGTYANDVYGYYVTDSSGANLIWAERNAGAPINIGSIAAESYNVIPRMEFKNQS